MSEDAAKNWIIAYDLTGRQLYSTAINESY